MVKDNNIGELAGCSEFVSDMAEIFTSPSNGMQLKA